jgi:hypothetical protein
MAWWSKLILSLSLALSLWSPAPVLAQQSLGQAYSNIMTYGLIYANICSGAAPTQACIDCRDQGRCTVEQLLQVVLNVGYLIMGLSGTVALLMFLWGGLDWILARGDSGAIEQGKNTMVAATVGLVVIFTAYAIVTMTIALITGQPLGQSLESTIQGAGGTAPFTTVNPE